MDVFAYKCPPSSLVCLGSFELTLRPISQLKIDKARHAARSWFASHGVPGVEDGALFDLELCVQTLAIATGLEPSEMRQLDPEMINNLYTQWLELQMESLPDVERIIPWIKRGMYLDSKTIVDGILTAQCETPAEFYGLPLSELTTGQVLYYTLVRNAYLTKCEEQEKHPNKMISKKVLEEQCR